MRKRDELADPRSCMSRARDDECWLPVAKFGGRYEVSSLGRIRRTATARIRKPRLDAYGYPVVCVRINGKYKPFVVHRLAWEAFAGPITKGMEVNHKDGNKQNNNLTNLELVTHAENVRHATATGLTARGERHYKATLSAEQIREIRTIHAAGGRYEGGPTFASTARRFGVTAGAIVRIVRRATWQHLS